MTDSANKYVSYRGQITKVDKTPQWTKSAPFWQNIHQCMCKLQTYY